MTLKFWFTKNQSSDGNGPLIAFVPTIIQKSVSLKAETSDKTLFPTLETPTVQLKSTNNVPHIEPVSEGQTEEMEHLFDKMRRKISNKLRQELRMN